MYLRYEPVLQIDPYRRNPDKCMDFCQGNWGSILKLDPVGENFPLKFPPQISYKQIRPYANKILRHMENSLKINCFQKKEIVSK
jgi:hypothetical protein